MAISSLKKLPIKKKPEKYSEDAFDYNERFILVYPDGCYQYERYGECGFGLDEELAYNNWLSLVL